MFGRPRRRLLALATTVLVAGSACVPVDGTDAAVGRTAGPSRAPSSAPPTGGSLRVGLSAQPATLDPRFLIDPEGELVADAVFDGLTRLDSSLAVRPEAAEAWTADDGSTTWTFTLRDGVFHNGEPVDAAAFKRAFDRIADGRTDPPSPAAGLLRRIVGFEASQQEGVPLAGVEVVDPTTLRLRLSEPFTELPLLLTDPALAPVPEAADTDPRAFARRPIGNGPFALAAERGAPDFVRVRAVDDHPRRARVDEVVFQIYADDPGLSQQFADFEAGRLDVASVPPGDLRYARRTYGPSADGYTGPGVLTGESAALYYLGFNTTAPPFDDPVVRRAISLLIDRDAIARDTFLGTRSPADALTPPGLPGHRAGTCTWCRFSPDEARTLLAAREQPLPEPLRLVHNAGRVHQSIAQGLADQIETVLDVAVEVVDQDLDDYVDRLDAGEMHIFRLGWEAPYPSASAMLEPLFRSDQPGPDNYTRYASPQVDDLLGRARAEPDLAARQALLAEAEQLVLDDAPVAPVVFYRHGLAVADGVVGLRVTPMGGMDLATVSLADTE